MYSHPLKFRLNLSCVHAKSLRRLSRGNTGPLDRFPASEHRCIQSQRDAAEPDDPEHQLLLLGSHRVAFQKG